MAYVPGQSTQRDVIVTYMADRAAWASASDIAREANVALTTVNENLQVLHRAGLAQTWPPNAVVNRVWLLNPSQAMLIAQYLGVSHDRGFIDGLRSRLVKAGSSGRNCSAEPGAPSTRPIGLSDAASHKEGR